MVEPVRLRWLGVAGSEWTMGGRTLAIDPFFTRPPFRCMWFGRVTPNRRLVGELMPRCDAILVTHSHWDHLMDVPDIARQTGAHVFGSPNTCGLLAQCGVPQEQIHSIAIGDHRTVAGFEIDVFPAHHPHLPIDRLVNGPLSSTLRPPLRLFDYRMDFCFSFLIQVAGWRILSGDQPVAADVWLGSPFGLPARIAPLLHAIRPRLVVPIHWDNLFRPLNNGIRPMLAPLACMWPPLHMLDVVRLSRQIEALSPGTKTLIPQVLYDYSLDQILSSSERASP